MAAEIGRGVDVLFKQRGPLGNFRLSHAVFMTTPLLATDPSEAEGGGWVNLQGLKTACERRC
jgi:hypothetical protein